MKKGAISPQARSLIVNKLQEHKIELADIEYKKEPNGRILRIYIDTENGVDSDTCVLATRAIKDFIDTLEDLDYDFLEVSSPGIDRILKKDSDFARFQGVKVLVKTSQPIEGRKKFTGILADTNQDILSLKIDENLVHINRDVISIVRLHPDI